MIQEDRWQLALHLFFIYLNVGGREARSLKGVPQT